MSTTAVRSDSMSNAIGRHADTSVARPGLAPLLLAFAAVYVIWGSTFLAIRFAVQTIPPLLTMAARSGGAGLILYLAARATGVPAPSRRQWVQAFIVGGMLFLICHGVLAWAEQRIASGPAALLASTIPLWMVLFDWKAGTGPRPSLGVILGLAIGFAGVAMLVLPSDHASAGGVDLLTACAMMCGSASWVAGSLYSRHAGFPKSVALATGMQLLAGGALLLIAAVVFGEMHRLLSTTVSAKSIWSVIYLIVFGSVVAFTAYNWLLRVTTPARLSTYSYVNPVVAVLLGWLAAGEPLGIRMILPTAVIVAGVATTLVARSKARSS
jgi:drug/metabolite transporter (DMT)-like permease